jgi:hypothetical protein
VLRVPPDPYPRFDTNDYSLDPELVGRRASRAASTSARSSRSRWTAACWPAAIAAASRATNLEHARTLKAQRQDRRGGDPVEVEVRSLDRYDALIALPPPRRSWRTFPRAEGTGGRAGAAQARRARSP